MSSPSSQVKEFVHSLIEAAAEGDTLYGLALTDNPFDKLDSTRGVIISNAEWDFSPTSEETLKVYDVLIGLAIYARVDGPDKISRDAARDDCFEIADTLARGFFADPTLGSQFCDSKVGRAVDGYRNISSASYAVINLPLMINPTGNTVDQTIGDVSR